MVCGVHMVAIWQMQLNGPCSVAIVHHSLWQRVSNYYNYSVTY